MWENAETVALLDRQGVVRAISRNEQEAEIKHVIGVRNLEERTVESCRAAAHEAFENALNGLESELVLGNYGEDGLIVWSRVVMKPSPLSATPVLVHLRRLPQEWAALSPREQGLINALHKVGLNPKKAAKKLGISLNTLNAHRRSIMQKCVLEGIGDFWVFVERCR